LGKYSRRQERETPEAKIDALIGEVRETNNILSWIKQYIEESEVAECLNEIADNTSAMRQVFEKVSKIQGGVGVVSSLLNGIVANVGKTRESK